MKPHILNKELQPIYKRWVTTSAAYGNAPIASRFANAILIGRKSLGIDLSRLDLKPALMPTPIHLDRPEEKEVLRADDCTAGNSSNSF